ncbi:MAG: 50S ribosomal protein L31 [Patescibacteria group bacterium]
MKQNIHPQYYPKSNIQCACGAGLKRGATKENVAVEICSQCHPYYTGKEKIIDAAGRVEKYKTRAAKAHKSSSKK